MTQPIFSVSGELLELSVSEAIEKVTKIVNK